MQAGLYDVLRGRFFDGTPCDAVPEHEQRSRSVLSNLSRLFNTRKGALHHLPDYGLPEAVTIYRDATYPIEELRQHIKEAVGRYEPRLRRVRIERLPDADDDIRVAFLISAELQDGERVRFQTMFSTSDLVEVHPLMRRG
jgi:type VI secretion system protein